MVAVPRWSQGSSDRTFRRKHGRAVRRGRTEGLTKAESQDAWRTSLGRAGRAVMSAVDRARALLRAGGFKKKARWVRRGERKDLQPGDKIEFKDLQKWRACGARYKRSDNAHGAVSVVRPTNDDKAYTDCWIIIERSRGERERDRRLSRFVACPIEFTKLSE